MICLNNSQYSHDGVKDSFSCPFCNEVINTSISTSQTTSETSTASTIALSISTPVMEVTPTSMTSATLAIHTAVQSANSYRTANIKKYGKKDDPPPPPSLHFKVQVTHGLWEYYSKKKNLKYHSTPGYFYVTVTGYTFSEDYFIASVAIGGHDLAKKEFHWKAIMKPEVFGYWSISPSWLAKTKPLPLEGFIWIGTHRLHDIFLELGLP